MKWEREISVARRAALEAGNVLTSRFGHMNSITKKGEIDLVTEADLLSERAILDILGRNFPRDGILVEEAGEVRTTGSRAIALLAKGGSVSEARQRVYSDVPLIEGALFDRTDIGSGV